jgi:hypothetical protein
MSKKSIWAVMTGILAVIGVTTLVDILLHVAHVYPPMDQPLTDPLAALATAYRIPISIAGAWLTARLAPDRPLFHAMVLGYVGTVLGLVGVVTTWNKHLGPHWYPILLTILSVPQCWIGGVLFERRHRSS